MTAVQTIVKNTGILLFAQIIVAISSFILGVYIARYLGDVEFGKYSFVLVFTSIFAIISHSGMHLVVTRDIARNKLLAGKYLINATFIELILSTIAFFLIIITINFMNYPYDTKLIVYLMGIAVILDSTFIMLFNSIFRAFEKMEYEALVLLLQKTIFNCLGLFILFIGYGLIQLVLVYLLINIAAFLFSYLIITKKFPIITEKFRISYDLIDRHFCRYLILTAMPFGLAGVSNLIYARIDTILLSIMKGDAVVGWYSAAYTLAAMLSFVNTALITALFPAMSNAFTSSEKSLNIIYEKSLKFSLIILFPFAIGTTFLANKIILFVYGIEFTNSVAALQILIWSGALSFLNSLFYTTLGATNRQKTVPIIMSIGATINIILNILLIPTLSYIGSGIAAIATQGICLVLAFYLVSKHVYAFQINKDLAKSLIASIGMLFFIFYFETVNLLILVFAAAIVYFIILACIKGFSKDDLKLFKNLIKIT